MADEEPSDAPAAIVQDERLGGEPRPEGNRIDAFRTRRKHLYSASLRE